MQCRNQAIRLGGLVRPSKEWGRFEAAPPSELLTLGATRGSISAVSRVRSLILPDERRPDAWPIDLVCDVIDAPSAGGWVRAHFPEQRLVIEPSHVQVFHWPSFFNPYPTKWVPMRPKERISIYHSSHGWTTCLKIIFKVFVLRYNPAKWLEISFLDYMWIYKRRAHLGV